MSLASDRTPYAGVYRVPPGSTAVWDRPDRPPVITQDCGPDVWPHPDLEGPDVVDRYLDTFDSVVDELVVDGEPLCAAMSGGLDRPVHAFCHVPHPDAPIASVGNWDPDDSDAARSMERAGPLTFVPIANLERRQPLDVADEVSQRCWFPVFNPGNAVWMESMRQRAHDLGASQLWEGENGNSAFSFDHPYALGHHLRHGEWSRAASVRRSYRESGLSDYRIAKRYLVGPIVRGAQRRLGPQRPTGIDPFAPRPRPAPMNSERFRGWLSRQGALSSGLQEAPGLASYVDPFTAQPVLDLAAAITPSEWLRYGTDRGYARRLGLGRVPDDIRLRTRRGGQSWDEWFIIHDQRERYLDEAAALKSTPIIGDALDATSLARIRDEVARWSWGDPTAIPPMLHPVQRLFSLAGFVRSTTERLRGLPVV